MSRTRFSSKGVPSNRMTGGKKSLIEGPWNSLPPPSSAARGRLVRNAEGSRGFS